MKRLFPVLLLLLFSSCATVKPPLSTPEFVNLDRFMGEWFVIATIPWAVEKNNVATRDIYRPLGGDRIEVTYAFRKGSLDAPEQEWKAKAWVVNKTTNAEWKVQFFWPLSLPYIITDLDPDYEWVVIGHPSRDYLWIMSRNPTLPRETLGEIIQRVEAQAFDPARIQTVPQLPGQEAQPVLDLLKTKP